MSGGVDSSVAAAILKSEGYDVIGITMQIWPRDNAVGSNGCCGLGAIEDARKVAASLGISHYVLNFREVFARKVIANFCQEYSLGRTPNPCIRCNQHIKFDVLQRRAVELDATFIATGHYARVQQVGTSYNLLKGIDPAKDQSYFLYTLTQQQLARLLLPIGSITKRQVRKMAATMDLPTAARKESQDICFVPKGDYHSFIGKYLDIEAGYIVDSKGNILGKHRGLPFYTIGQRHRLDLNSEQRLYVLKLNADNNQIIVGPEGELFTHCLTAAKLNWIAGETPEGNGISAKIRYKAAETPVELGIEDGNVEVRFERPQRAITPGQAVVFYRGEVVLGGGTIHNLN
jgi:tRNA-specific 2-thiouridylase